MKDNAIIEEVIYLLNEYYSKEYTEKEFESRIEQLLKENKISKKSAEIVIEKIFKFKYDPKYGLIWQGGSCGGSYIKKPHLGQPGLGSQSSGGC